MKLKINNEMWSNGNELATMVELSCDNDCIRFHCIDETHALKFFSALESLIKDHTVDDIKGV